MTHRGHYPRLALAGLVAVMPLAVHARPVGPELPRAVAWKSAAEVPATSFLGRQWRAAIDSTTQVPSRLWGPGLAAPGAVASPEVALALAHTFLTVHLAALAPGSSLDDFQLVANDLDAGQRTVAFEQYHRGIPVLGGQLSLRFKNDRLFVISSQAIPVTESPRATSSRLTAAALRDAAVRWITAEVAPAAASPAALGPPSYLPYLANDGTIELRLVRTVVVATAPSPRHDRFDVFVDAATGEPLARRSLLHRASGTLHFNAPSTHAGAGGTRMDYPVPSLTVTLDGATAETDTDGVFAFANATAELVVGVAGRFVDVLDATGAGLQFTQTLTATDGGTLVVDERADEIADAQISAYVHVNLVKDWAREVTNGSLPWLDEKLVINANMPNVCNAYYDGGTGTLNFFQAGGYSGINCQNTALVADVIHHEFGHAFHDHAILEGAGWFDTSVSEGISDYIAASMSNDPRMGIGFFTDDPDVPMRHLDDVDRVLPDDIELDVHANGLIAGGAMWDLRKALGASDGADGVLVADRLLYQALRRTTDMGTLYLELVAADDDDGNLVNGTPHGCAITAAFARHGLVPEGAYGTAGVQRPVIEGNTFVVNLRPSACAETAVTSLAIESRRRGVDGSDAMTPLEATTTTPDADGFIRYEAGLPFVPDGGVLQYRVIAELAGGDAALYPENPADPYYEHFAGEVTPVLCDDLDGAAYPQGFSHELTAGDQGYGADEWAWGVPRGGLYSSDPVAAYSGTNVFGTDLGGSTSEGWYPAGRSARLSTPTLAVGMLEKNTRVHLQYRRWVSLAKGDRVEIAANDHPVWSSLAPSASAPIHRDREWVFHDVDVTDQVAADGSLRIDFSIIADNSRESGGWNIDDICVVTAAAPSCTIADCPEESEDSAGCGCRTTSTSSTALLGLAGMFVLRRRRR